VEELTQAIREAHKVRVKSASRPIPVPTARTTATIGAIALAFVAIGYTYIFTKPNAPSSLQAVQPQQQPAKIAVTASKPARVDSPLSAGSASATQERVPERSKVASQPPAAATQVAGTFVQVSSQKTRAEALASFAALQAKYPEALQGVVPDIYMANLGDRGVFYRVRIGPFNSSEAARAKCQQLMSAGGQCVVTAY
jgi:cell division protein FtsN